MDNLWLLTEERPKPSVVLQIIEMYCADFNDIITKHEVIKIKPLIENGVFRFIYEVEGLAVSNADGIYIKTVSGYSSFLDFLLFKQQNEPQENNLKERPIMGLEETKTSDDESRNTGVSQRVSKFVYFRHFYDDVKMYMLYNEELEARTDKKPSDTSIFGTNILLSLGVTIVGKDISKWFKPFVSVDEMIAFKAKMRKPPKGNIPIEITKNGNTIEVSGRLDKPAGKGNIAHDPSMGSLSMIGAGLRMLGWKGDIVITRHGVSQTYVSKNKTNKFLFNCRLLGMQLYGLIMPDIELPKFYWHYEKKSEKMADILLHVQATYHDIYCVYENHAGCERGYFRTKGGKLITLPKKDANNVNLYLPDVVLYDKLTNCVLLVEGKMISTLEIGLKEIQNYDSIEKEYINRFYPDVTIMRCLSIFGGNHITIPHDKVLFYLADDGRILINKNAPDCIKRAFSETGVII